MAVVRIAAGAVIAVVFAGGLAVVLWFEVSDLIAGTSNGARLMSTLLIGPMVGLAPALLGLALAQRGWRRLRGSQANPDSNDDDSDSDHDDNDDP